MSKSIRARAIRAVIGRAHALRSAVKTLKAAGLSWERIEKELRLRPWLVAGLCRHTPRVSKTKLRRTGAHAIRALRGTLKSSS